MEQARVLVGDEWLNRHKKIVQQHEAMYLRLAWSKVRANFLAADSECFAGGETAVPCMGSVI